MRTLNGNVVLWLQSHDRNPFATALADRHYSRKHIGAKNGFVGPGEKLVLMSPDNRALFVWLRANPDYRGDKQKGINCTIFRNESSVLSSKLISEAEAWALKRWPDEKRLFTYVGKTKVKSSKPGWCFIKAGWKIVGENKSGKLVLLEKLVSSNSINAVVSDSPSHSSQEPQPEG